MNWCRVHSSYAVNHYAEVFTAIVRAFRPMSCVELGTLEGYSAIAIAQGLIANHVQGEKPGHLDCYDLFEKYPYRHSTLEQAKANIAAAGVNEVVSLYEEDAVIAHNYHEPDSVDLLHIDLSNTGVTVAIMIERWHPRIRQGGLILVEGGSDERDHVEWMAKYGALPIKPELERNVTIANHYVFGTYLAFPSLTCLLKKR